MYVQDIPIAFCSIPLHSSQRTLPRIPNISNIKEQINKQAGYKRPYRFISAITTKPFIESVSFSSKHCITVSLITLPKIKIKRQNHRMTQQGFHFLGGRNDRTSIQVLVFAWFSKDVHYKVYALVGWVEYQSISIFILLRQKNHYLQLIQLKTAFQCYAYHLSPLYLEIFITRLHFYYFPGSYKLSLLKGASNLSQSEPNHIYYKNMQKIVLSLLLISLVCAFKPCEPFGTRIFFGEVAQNKESQEKLEIYFNTASECNRSYVQLIRRTGLEKIDCSITALNLSKNVNNYQAFIHKCKINTINFGEAFHYNAFGWDGSSSNPIPFSADFIPLKLADITNKNMKLNLIVLADWSPLEKNLGKYTPLDDLFASVLNKQEIHGILINGDVGYDLDTNNCLNYQSFLVMLSKTAATVPIIMVTGNHQYNTADNYQLFQSSFQLYNLDTEFATYLELGPLYLLPFDPYHILYDKKIAKDPAIDKFNSIMKSAKESNKFIVPTSHYPLACSGTSKNCKSDRNDLKAYWKTMFDTDISLYIGAHYHSYQRTLPYLPTNEFLMQDGSYRDNEGYIISIVQGVAGNDKDIVESIDTVESFTASYTVNETGFGVFSIDQNAVNYVHYSTKRGITDQISIARQAGKGNLMRQ